jgi:CheY-like chemotaxis protein
METKLKNKVAGKTFLIVEDDLISAEFLMELFEGAGAKIIYVINGEDAVKIVKDNPNISLVLMDIRLPGMNGYKATKEIKKLRKDLPVIAQTAHALDGDREKALETGCDAYISKPIDTAILIELVLRLLKV